MKTNEITKKAIKLNYCAANLSAGWVTWDGRAHAAAKYWDDRYRTVIFGEGDVRMYAVMAMEEGWIRIGWAILQHGPGPILPLDKMGVVYVTADRRGMDTVVDEDLREQLVDDWGILWAYEIAAEVIAMMVDVDDEVNMVYTGDEHGSRVWGEVYVGSISDTDDLYVSWVDGGYHCDSSGWGIDYYVRHCAGRGQEVTYIVLYDDDLRDYLDGGGADDLDAEKLKELLGLCEKKEVKK